MRNMRTTKDMMLQSQKNPIRLATDSLHFGEEIRNKNLYGQEGQTKPTRMVFKQENQDTLSILLETLIQLLENLRFHQSGTNISIQQKVWQQEIVRQIKNQINIYQQYHVQGNLQQAFQQLQNEQAFEHTEILEQTIENIRQELKKNADAIIQERTPIFHRIGHTLFSVSAYNEVQKSKKLDFYMNQVQSQYHAENMSVWEKQVYHTNVYPMTTFLYHNQNVWFGINRNSPFLSASLLYPMRARSIIQENAAIWYTQKIQQNIPYDMINTFTLSQMFRRKQNRSYHMLNQTNGQYQKYYTTLYHTWQKKSEQHSFHVLSPFMISLVSMQKANRIQQKSLLLQKYGLNQKDIYVSQYAQESNHLLDISFQQIHYRKQNETNTDFYQNNPSHDVQIQNFFSQEMQKQYSKNILLFYDQKRCDINAVQWKQQMQQNLIHSRFAQYRQIQNQSDTILQNKGMLQKTLTQAVQTQMYYTMKNWMLAPFVRYNLLQESHWTWQQLQSIYKEYKEADLWRQQNKFFQMNENRDITAFLMQQTKSQNVYAFSDFQWKQNFINLLQITQSDFITQTSTDTLQNNKVWTRDLWLKEQIPLVFSTKPVWQNTIYNNAKQKMGWLPTFSRDTHYKRLLQSVAHMNTQKNRLLGFSVLYETLIEQKTSFPIFKQLKYRNNMEMQESKSWYHLQKMYAPAYDYLNKRFIKYEIRNERENVSHEVILLHNQMPTTLQSVKQEHTAISLFWKKLQHIMLYQQKMIQKFMKFVPLSFAKQFHTVQKQFHRIHTLQNQIYFPIAEHTFHTNIFDTDASDTDISDTNTINSYVMLYPQPIQRNMVTWYQNMPPQMLFAKMQNLIRNQQYDTFDTQNIMQAHTAFAIAVSQKNNFWKSQYRQTVPYRQNLWYQMTPRFFSQEIYHQPKQVVLHTAQTLHQDFNINLQPVMMQKKQEISKHYEMSGFWKKEKIFSYLENQMQLYFSDFWKFWQYGETSVFVRNVAQKYISEISKLEKMFQKRIEKKSENWQKNLLYHNIAVDIRKSILSQSQTKTIWQKYGITHIQSKIHHMVFPLLQSKEQQGIVSAKTKQSVLHFTEKKLQSFKPQISVTKIDTKKITEHTEIEHTKKSLVTIPLEQWKTEKEYFYHVSAEKQNVQQWTQKESFPFRSISNLQNTAIDNQLQTEFIHKKEKQTILHDTELQQEWEEAVTIRVLEKVQNLWEEQKENRLKEQKLQQPTIAQSERINALEQENYTISALELERMYDKIYTRIERTLASERRRMGL